jgi:hypothetical protein
VESEFTVRLASDITRDQVAAEIWWRDQEMLGELCEKDSALLVTIYPRATGEPWSFSFERLLEALDRARHRLARR